MQLKVEKGITISDQDTGSLYCVTIKSGALITASGECGVIASPSAPAPELSPLINDSGEMSTTTSDEMATTTPSETATSTSS